MGTIENQASGPVSAYRFTKGLRIFFLVGIPPSILLFLYLMVLPFIEGDSETMGIDIFLSIISVGMTGFLVYLLIAIFKWRIEIFPDRIREVSLFTKKEMMFDNVMGIKVLPTNSGLSNIEFVPKHQESKKKFQIPLTMERVNEFCEWLDATFINLTQEELGREFEAISKNEDMGIDGEERLGKLEKAGRVSKVLNAVAVLVVLWALVYPEPYELLIVILVAFPLLIIFLLRYFSGLLRLDEKPGSVYPSVAGAFIMPCMVLALRGLDRDILFWEPFWLPFIVFSLFLFMLVIVNAQEVRKKIGIMIIVFIFSFVYGFGATLTLNEILDISEPVIYYAEVLDKRSNEEDFYSLELSPWGLRDEIMEVDVHPIVYDRRGVGDGVEILLYEGAFKIPWFYVL